jgi:hypothetical protein
MVSMYNQLLTSLHDLNDVESTRDPSHNRDVTPILGLVLDTSVQVMRQNHHDEEGRITGATWYAFVQQVEDRGEEPKAIQMVLGEKALKALVRQYERLNSRSRPLARKRARERALENPTGFAKGLVKAPEHQEPEVEACGAVRTNIEGEEMECDLPYEHEGACHWEPSHEDGVERCGKPASEGFCARHDGHPGKCAA